jgi:hypothetical protein
MRTMLLAAAFVGAPGLALAQYGGGGSGGGGYRGGGYASPPTYHQPRYRTVCRYERVAAGYDTYGQPIHRREQICEQVAY